MSDDTLLILLIEDNEDDFLIIRDLLCGIAHTRYSVEWTASYASGLEAIRACRHHLILLDFRLSDGTGLELLKETQVIPNRAPVIFMTGQGDHEIDMQAMQSGASDYLVKDRLSADLLERVIRYAIERQKSAEALRVSEDRYRTFVDNSIEGIWRFELEHPMPIGLPEAEQIAYLDRHAYVAECNDSMARIYGFGCAAELLGTRFSEFLWNCDVSDDNYARQLIRNGYRLVSNEAFETDRHGTPKYILHNLIGVVENGLLHRIWSTQSDITTRKYAENALAQLAAIVETSDDAIYSETLEGLIVTWNKAAEALYGYAAEEVIGRPTSLLRPANKAEEMKLVQKRIRGGERVSQFETVRMHKDGRLIDVSLAVSPIIYAGGQVAGSSFIVRDISDRKRAEMRLRQSEANMAAAQHIAHFGSWEIDLYSKDDMSVNPRRWSDETFRIFGYDPGGVSETRDVFYDAVPPEEHDIVHQAIATAVAQQQQVSFVHRVRQPGGEERVIRQTAQYFEEDEVGQPPRLVGTAHDITEQRRLETQVTQSEKLAALGELVAGVAHEINNPLAAILSNAELLEMHADPQVRVDAQTIQRMSERITRIVRSLLTFARPQKEERRPEALNTLVEHMLEMTTHKLRTADVSLALRLQDPSPVAAANANEIQQVLLNLILNAEHALRGADGEKRIVVSTGAERIGGRDWATVSVADNGCGIPEKIRARIFDPFFTTKDVGEGTGLGLSICHGIAEAHGGRLSVESTIGLGTTFTLALPLLPHPRADAAQLPSPFPSPAESREKVNRS